MPPERRSDHEGDHDDMRVRMIHNRSHGPHRPRARDASPPVTKAPGTVDVPTLGDQPTEPPPDPGALRPPRARRSR